VGVRRRATLIIAKVTIKAGIEKRRIHAPLTAPHTLPTNKALNTASHAEGGVSYWPIGRIAHTALKATIETTERSMPRAPITKVAPIARIPIEADADKTAHTFAHVMNTSLETASAVLIIARIIT
jgi:hypothetical protein